MNSTCEKKRSTIMIRMTSNLHGMSKMKNRHTFHYDGCGLAHLSMPKKVTKIKYYLYNRKCWLVIIHPWPTMCMYFYHDLLCTCTSIQLSIVIITSI
jgi:hypothetical protein